MHFQPVPRQNVFVLERLATLLAIEFRRLISFRGMSQPLMRPEVAGCGEKRSALTKVERLTLHSAVLEEQMLLKPPGPTELLSAVLAFNMSLLATLN